MSATTFVSRHPAAPRRRRPGAVLALAVAAVMMLGATWAAWSDFVIVTGNRVGAGTLVIDGSDHLELWLPTRGMTDDATVGVANAGTTNADLEILFLADEAVGPLCDGYVPDDHDGDLRLLVDGVDVGPLCGALDTPIPVGSTAPGGSIDIPVAVHLAGDAMFRWSERTGTFPLEIRGNQPGGGFSDFVRGSLTVRIGDHAPDVELPGECPGQLGDYRAFHELGNGNEDLDLEALGVSGPAVVVALNGNHDVVGTPQDDCIIVGNGTMTVHGGGGDDTIVSAHPNGGARGGGRAQQLSGEAGDDTIIARRGNVGINGGPGADTCEAPSNSSVTIEECEAAVVLTTQNTEVSTSELEVVPLTPESLRARSEPTEQTTPIPEATPTQGGTTTEDATSTEPASPTDQKVTSDSVADIVPDDDGQAEPAIVPTEVPSDDGASESAAEVDPPSPAGTGIETEG